MSDISFPELTDLTKMSNMSSSASFNVPAADALVGTEKLISNNDASAYFGKCIQDFLEAPDLISGLAPTHACSTVSSFLEINQF